MFASENKFQKIIRTILDILNVLLGVGVVVLAVMAFINTDNNKWLFPIIFMMGGVMNLLRRSVTSKKSDSISIKMTAKNAKERNTYCSIGLPSKYHELYSNRRQMI